MASDEDRSQIRSMVARRLTVIAAAMAVVLCLVVVTYGVVLIRGTQNTNAPKIDNTATTLRLVEDCVTPGGTCYERGRKQTADAVGNISLSQVAAVACADQPGTQPPGEIRACVERTMRVFEAAKP